jgi:hypothetical protein
MGTRSTRRWTMIWWAPSSFFPPTLSAAARGLGYIGSICSFSLLCSLLGAAGGGHTRIWRSRSLGCFVLCLDDPIRVQLTKTGDWASLALLLH